VEALSGDNFYHQTISAVMFVFFAVNTGENSFHPISLHSTLFVVDIAG
jgi:hypothetical protein